MTIGVWDYDAIAYRSAAVTENTKIRAVHKTRGDEFVFKNRTELYGHYKKKAGGFLAQERAKGEEDYLPENFEIIEFSEPEPLSNALKIVKTAIESTNMDLKTKQHYGYLGGKGNFRVDISTLQKYKGNRDDMKRPTHLEDIKDYIRRNHGGIVVNDKEADDKEAEDIYWAWKKKEDKVGIILDKDYKCCEGNWYNFVDKKHFTVQGFGGLFLTAKSDVDGLGRLWKYYQIAFGDESDGYRADVQSDNKSTEKMCYNLLKDCKTDKEAWEVLVKQYKYLYPEPKQITTWKGDIITIDWLHCIQEITDLQHMQRWQGDCISVRDVLTKLGIAYV